MGKCQSGNCGITCTGECMCFSSTENPDDCDCSCDDSVPIPVPKPANKTRNFIVKGGKKIPLNKYRSRIKITPQARYDVCAHNIAVTTVAQFLDKHLPNRILIPTNKLTKKVNLSLKNKTFRQIIIASGLVLKS